MKLTIRHVTFQDANAWERMLEALWPGDPHHRDIASFFAGTAAEPLAVTFAAMAEQPIALIEISIRRDLPDATASPPATWMDCTSSRRSLAVMLRGLQNTMSQTK